MHIAQIQKYILIWQSYRWMKIIRFFATFHHWLSKKIVLTFIHCHLYANRTFDTDEHAIPSSPACSGLHTKFHPDHRAAQCATTIRSALTLRTLINELAVFRMILLTVSHSVMWNRYCHALFTVHLQVVYSYSSHRHIGRNNDDILPLHSNQKPIFCHYFELTEHAPFIMKPVIQAQMLIAQYWASIVDFLFCNCLSPRHCNLIDSSPLFTYVTNSTPIFCCCCCCSVCCCVLYVVCSYSPDAEYMQRYTLSPWQWLMLLLLPDCFALSFCLCYVQTGFVGTVFFFGVDTLYLSVGSALLLLHSFPLAKCVYVSHIIIDWSRRCRRDPVPERLSVCCSWTVSPMLTPVSHTHTHTANKFILPRNIASG